MVNAEQKLDKHWSEFTQLLKNGKADSYPEFFYYYCRHILDREGFEKYVRNARFLFELAKRPIHGAKILDVGCGFGIDSIIFACHGAAEVKGIDVNKDWIQSIHNYLKDLRWELPIETKVGDASKLEYPDDTFDVVLSVEAISHYCEVDAFLEESHRVLKRGGCLIISDGNNGANPLIRKKTYQVWDRFEHGPPAKSFHGHQIKRSFIDMRKDIIAKSYPKLSQAEVNELAENTFAMGNNEIVAVCDKYVQSGEKPNRPFQYGVPAFNPEKNDYIERLFDPRELAKQLNKIGFDVKAYAHFGGAGKRGLVSTLNSLLRALSPMTMLGARAFKIVATKR